MHNKGYIKLYRSSYKHHLFEDEPFSKRDAWHFLIAAAAFAPWTKSVREIPVKLNRGEVSISTRELAREWKWSREKVKRFLNRLEGESMLSPQRSKLGNRYTIVNYDKYQGNESINESTDESTDESKKEEGIKEGIKEDRKRFMAPTYEEAFDYFIQRGVDPDIAERQSALFIDHHTARGWILSNGRKMKDWKAASRTWVSNIERFNPRGGRPLTQKEKDNERRSKIARALNAESRRTGDGNIERLFQGQEARRGRDGADNEIPLIEPSRKEGNGNGI